MPHYTTLPFLAYSCKWLYLPIYLYNPEVHCSFQRVHHTAIFRLPVVYQLCTPNTMAVPVGCARRWSRRWHGAWTLPVMGITLTSPAISCHGSIVCNVQALEQHRACFRCQWTGRNKGFTALSNLKRHAHHPSRKVTACGDMSYTQSLLYTSAQRPAGRVRAVRP